MPPVKNVFDVLEDSSEERGTRRASIVAVARAKKQMGAFFKQAADEADFDARLSLVADTLNDIVREACVENSTSNFDIVARVLAGELAHFAEVMRTDVKANDIAPVEEDEEGDGQMHVRGLAGRKLLGLDSQLEENGGKIAGGHAELQLPCSVCGDGGHTAMGGHDWANGQPNPHPAPRHPADGMGALDQMPDGSESPLERAMREANVDHPRDCDCKECNPTDEDLAKGLKDLRQLPHDVEPPKREFAGKTKWKVAVETGDTYTQETVDLPKANESGLSDDPSPKMDSASAGDENHTSQKPIDIPSARHNPEVQDITEHADYTKALETPSGVATRVDADKPMQQEFNAAPDTQTWNGTKDQANPVTSKWKVVS